MKKIDNCNAAGRLKLTSPTVIRKLLREHGIQLQKRWGQHFLCDENLLNKIIATAQLTGEELVIEPGAGLGTLTLALAKRARKVIAVERDPRLIPLLRANLQAAGATNVEVRQADVLKLDFAQLITKAGFAQARVVGNLPYVITAPFLEKLTVAHERIAVAILMIQQEVADKLLASPGPQASALGIRVRAFADVSLIKKVPRTVFFPPPEVDSALIELRFLARPRFTADAQIFFQVVRAAFNLRRKTLRQALRHSSFLQLPPEAIERALTRAGIEGARRGETLSIEEFDRLAHAIQRVQRAQ